MILWLTRDGFYAGLLGVGIVVAFVGYNTYRSLRRRYAVVRRRRP
ncbi:MAG TPA: hypothetical protein VMF61_15830 [Candidatus Acidoferrales bacterium]|nr:hypothetical protein [Candidatus Acidoferrales bacterium]